MSRPYICWLALILSVVFSALSLAALGMAWVALTEVHELMKALHYGKF